uniref:UBIQUITIN_CONJUGAT_2 domain-containing protein n=1 Tax=Elaeophora elaphi TaxID=1147741 RepID=A0A0R3RRF8_9BILA
MKRRNSVFLSSGSGFSDIEGVEIATEMAPGEPLRLSPELITEHIIMSEYAMICRDPIDGLYAVPSARNKFEWFGLLFIRRGVYAGAVFRFTLHLPVDFPSTELPIVVFDLDVFHPHVNPATRELDLKKYFVDGWKSDQHHLYHRTFFTFDSNPATCANAEAAALLRDNRELYRMRASELIRKSRSIIYEPVDQDDANAIRLMPWDASIHEPLRQRLIGGLTDSQISTMSLLGSLGCGLNRSSVFESRSKHGFSWISPTDLCYMVEPPRPAELDLKIISEAENCPRSAGPSYASCPGALNNRGVTNEVIIPHISKWDLNGESDFEQENEQESQKKSEKNDSGLLKDALQNDGVEGLIAKNDRKTGLVEETYEEWEGKELEIGVKPSSGLEKSAHRKNEYVKSQQNDVSDRNTIRARSGWNSDEVGESDI